MRQQRAYSSPHGMAMNHKHVSGESSERGFHDTRREGGEEVEEAEAGEEAVMNTEEGEEADVEEEEYAEMEGEEAGVEMEAEAEEVGFELE